MGIVFADTGYWVALLNPHDDLHNYEQRPDQEWSLTDCLSFYIMTKLDINQALAYDRHFAQVGFVPLMRNFQSILNPNPSSKKRKRDRRK
jgi:predicted nucleic acid-binding protein